MGILAYFIIGTPREVRWLNEEEKRAAVLRTMKNKTGSDREKRAEFKKEQVWAAFKGGLIQNQGLANETLIADFDV